MCENNKNPRVIPRERHAGPPFPPPPPPPLGLIKSKKELEFLVPKDSQCSETYAETLFKIFSFSETQRFSLFSYMGDEKLCINVDHDNETETKTRGIS